MRIIVVALLMLACGGQTTFGTGDSGHATAYGYNEDENDAYAGETTAGDLVPPVVAEGMGKYTQQTDAFEQHERGLLDILIVIDNSGSMNDEQVKLASNLPNLLHYLKDSDWQIAVTSGDIDDCLHGTITKDTSDYENKYSALVNVGSRGNGEFVFYQAIQGLQGNCNNSSSAWLRRGSTVAILVVTDECNKCISYASSCREGNMPTTALCTSNDLNKHLNGIRPRGNARVYGLLPSETNHEWTKQISADPDTASLFAARGAIDAANYNTILEEISKDVHGVLENVFVLSKEPAGVVAVTVNGATLTTERYEVDTSSKLLKFNQGYVPTENAQIKVTYYYRSD